MGRFDSFAGGGVRSDVNHSIVLHINFTLPGTQPKHPGPGRVDSLGPLQTTLIEGGIQISPCHIGLLGVVLTPIWPSGPAITNETFQSFS